MHVVFAVSAVLMLLGTVWMMADDNDRPWKDYQRKFNNLDLWATDARITEQTIRSITSKKTAELEQAVTRRASDFHASRSRRGRRIRPPRSAIYRRACQAGERSRPRFPLSRRDRSADEQIARSRRAACMEIKDDPEAVRRTRADAARDDERSDRAIQLPRRPFHARNQRPKSHLERDAIAIRSGRRPESAGPDGQAAPRRIGAAARPPSIGAARSRCLNEPQGQSHRSAQGDGTRSRPGHRSRRRRQQGPQQAPSCNESNCTARPKNTR